MIIFNANSLKTWNSKIVYSPNSLKKAVNANETLEKSSKDTRLALLFTRHKIELLVSNYASSIFFDESAKNAKKSKKIIEMFKNANSYLFEINSGAVNIQT